MNKTGSGLEKKSEVSKLAVDTDELMNMLSCGKQTAVKIGEESYARIQIGRRVLWNVEKVKRYLFELSA